MRAAAAAGVLIAVGLAGANPPARADDGLALYGTVDTALRYDGNGEGRSRLGLRSGQASGSRLGLRGSERLGRGLEVNFHLEAGFDADTGAGQGERGTLAWNRRSTVGLVSDFGSLTVGRQYRAETRAVFVMDPFEGSSVASPPNTWSNLVFRSANAVVYESPRVAGLQALLMLAPGEAAGGAGDDRGLALLYRRGGLRLAYGWDRRVNASADDARRWQSLGGSYELRGATLYAAWRSRKEGAAGLDERSGWIGLAAPLGAFTVRGTLGALDDRGPERHAATALGLGLDYRLSARAGLYARYAGLRNRNGADLAFDEAIDGRRPRSLALGLELRF